MQDFDFQTAFGTLDYCSRQPVSIDDRPTIFISYSGIDRQFVKLVRNHLDPALEALTDPVSSQPFRAWDYGKESEGTELGGHFPEEIANRMWNCRGAIILISPNYMRSFQCKEIELPFLLWRWRVQGLKLFPVRLNTTVLDRRPFKIPGFQRPEESIRLADLVDDRNPSLMEGDNDLMLAALVERSPHRADQRLVRYVEAICEVFDHDKEKLVPQLAVSPTIIAAVKPEPVVPIAPALPIPASMQPAETLLPVRLEMVALEEPESDLPDTGTPEAAEGMESSQMNARASSLEPSGQSGPNFRAFIRWRLLGPILILLAGLALVGGWWLTATDSGASFEGLPERQKTTNGMNASKSAQHDTGALSGTAVPVNPSSKATNQNGSLTPHLPEKSSDANSAPQSGKEFTAAQVPAVIPIAPPHVTHDNNKNEALQQTQKPITGPIFRLSAATALLKSLEPQMTSESSNGRFEQARLLLTGTGCDTLQDCRLKALQVYLELASSGSALVDAQIGTLFRGQQMVPGPDGCNSANACDAKAVQFFYRAAVRGSVSASFDLAKMFDEERGVFDRPPGQISCARVSDCRQQAVFWYVMAGTSSALDRLAELVPEKSYQQTAAQFAAKQRLELASDLLKGNTSCGSQIDCDALAADSLFALALSGNSEAQGKLSDLYLTHRGVLNRPGSIGCNNARTCDAKAASWAFIAAASGDAVGQYKLAALYEQQTGVRGTAGSAFRCNGKDDCINRARYWYIFASAMPEAIERLTALDSGRVPNADDLSRQINEQYLQLAYEELDFPGECQNDPSTCVAAAVPILQWLSDNGNPGAQLELADLILKRWAGSKLCVTPEECQAAAIPYLIKAKEQGVSAAGERIKAIFQQGPVKPTICADNAICAAIDEDMRRAKAQAESDTKARLERLKSSPATFVAQPPALPLVSNGRGSYDSISAGSTPFGREKSWTNMKMGSAWAEYALAQPTPVQGIYIGSAGTEFTAEKSHVALFVREGPEAQWIQVFRLDRKVINRDLKEGQMDDQVGSVWIDIGGIQITGVRIEMGGRGWFTASDIRVLAPKDN